MSKIKVYAVCNITEYQNVLAISLTPKGAQDFLAKYGRPKDWWVEEITLTEKNFWEVPD